MIRIHSIIYAYIYWHRYLPAPLPKPIAAYINSMVLLRGTFPVDLKDTSSVFTVRGGPSVTGVFGDEAWEETGDIFFIVGDSIRMDVGAGLSVWRTTSSFHFFTIVFALIDNFVSWCVLNFPIVFPISVFYWIIYQYPLFHKFTVYLLPLIILHSLWF